MSLMLPRFFREKKPLDLLPVPDEEDLPEPIENGIEAVNFFEDILNKDQLSDLDGNILKLGKALRTVVLNKAEIDQKAIEQERDIRGLGLKLKNCKGKNKKTSQQRQSYQVQIELEKNLLDGLKKQSDELEALKSQMESKMSFFKDEKRSIEEKPKL